MSIYELVRAPDNEGEFPWPEDALRYVVDERAGSLWWETAEGSRPLTKAEIRAVLTLYRAERVTLYGEGRFTILGLDEDGRPIILDRVRHRQSAVADGD
ncbi:hypothetical protein [Azospirillum sp. SYSU D00513]|uniref:hypothetical protein n=1 Tax=Azospirillum sp. SYSU D00513 TaxID=2812561 RepID=UPI001A96CE7D|nr:hypothetical protein [Azospirillum sp. SYSU D00513]